MGVIRTYRSAVIGALGQLSQPLTGTGPAAGRGPLAGSTTTSAYGGASRVTALPDATLAASPTVTPQVVP